MAARVEEGVGRPCGSEAAAPAAVGWSAAVASSILGVGGSSSLSSLSVWWLQSRFYERSDSPWLSPVLLCLKVKVSISPAIVPHARPEAVRGRRGEVSEFAVWGPTPRSGAGGVKSCSFDSTLHNYLLI